MPEGDTIAAARNRLAPLIGQELSVETPHPRFADGALRRAIEGRTISDVRSRGKHLLIDLSDSRILHIHLRMTGLLSVVAEGRRWSRAPHRAWLVLRAAGRVAILFDGPVLEYLTPAQARLHPVLSRLGPDVLAGAELGRASEAIRGVRPERRIGEVLLDQRILCGIGNVWKSEILHAEGISPLRPVAELTPGEVDGIVATAQSGMRRVVAGDQARPREVYGRAGKRCRRCGGRIVDLVQGDEGRRTYWCPGCQR
jgi:endonuclease-8